MAASDLVLVDASVWIRFLRVHDALEAEELDKLLASQGVATCPPIRAEVISGATSRRDFDRLRTLFESLPTLEPPDHVWSRIEEHRFILAKQGIQASLVDLWIALTAHAHHAALWTLDEDFRSIGSAIPLRRYTLQ